MSNQMKSSDSTLLARWAVDPSSVTSAQTPVSEPLALGDATESVDEACLYEVANGERIAVPFQLDLTGDTPRLCWILEKDPAMGPERVFEYHRGTGKSFEPVVKVREDGPDVEVTNHGRLVFKYRHGKSGIPEGAKSIYEREGGYLHPLQTPGGAVLTRIQPPDHYHHYGLWNPWTSTEIEGRKVDFWNLADKMGTVRSARILETTSGPVFGRLRVALDHVDKTGPTGEYAVMREEWRLDVWRASETTKEWIIDFTSILNPCAGIPVIIKAYRYQGLGLRARADWDDQTATLLTSEGKTRDDANGTRAKWMLLHGKTEVEGGESGLLMLGHPTNRDFPEPIRIWPTGMNDGKENIFVNFNPAQEKDWRLEPDQSYGLRYRLIPHDGKRDADWADRAWKARVGLPLAQRDDLSSSAFL